MNGVTTKLPGEAAFDPLTHYAPFSRYAVIPFVNAMNAVSRLISSSLNTVSL